MIKNLIFGTANFSPKYGLFKNKKFKSNKNIIEILKYLKKNKIYNLDTSIEYKNVDKKIKFSKFKKWKVITKINMRRFQNCKNEDEILKELTLLLEKTSKNMGVKNIEVLLLHNANLMFKKNGNKFFSILKKLKYSRKIKKFGYSIYDFNTIVKLIKDFKPDIIQCPYNIFDRRLNNNRIVRFLKKENIEIHARSIFLHGTLLKEQKYLPQKFSKWKHNFNKFEKWIKKNNYSKLEVCVNFAIHNKLIDKVVFGIEDLSQLKKFLNLNFRKKILVPKSLASDDINLLNPTKW